MKSFLMILMVFTTMIIAAEKLNPERAGFNIIMTDDKGMPLDDGIYNVTLKVYDKNIDGKLISESTEIFESKDGVCILCEDKLKEFSKKGYKEIWISLKIENYPEPKHRTRVFLDTYK